MFEFNLPDVGEGLTEAEILEWHVQVGDVVEVNQTLAEIETAKSAVELPSPVAGTVAAIHIESGVIVDVGTPILSIRDDTDKPVTDTSPVPDPSASSGMTTDEPDDESPQVLVGPGPVAATPRTRRLGARPTTNEETSAPANVPAASSGTVRAKPPVRLLARQLGVDLTVVRPADGDIITRRDVELAATTETSPEAPPQQNQVEPDYTARETRTPIKGVRKVTAAAVSASAFTAPHVTEFLTVDVTKTMDLLTRLKADRAWSGVRLTPLTLVARALQLTLRAWPDINAWWDDDAQEIVHAHYVNMGFAAATPRGLVVPNVKDAHALELVGLATAIEELVINARNGKTSAEQMANGTITITNIGAFGVDTGTPILNPGEAAILAFGAIRDMPWVVDGELAVRKVTQLALSFDHRLVNGELGSQVLATVGRLLHDPGEAFLLA